MIRTAVVDRGQEAIPPRELLTLRLPETPENPENPEAATETAVDAGPDGPAHLEDFSPFERGPEITEIR